MEKRNISGQFGRLESLYVERLLDIVASFPTNNGYIVWQEVFDNNVTLKNDTIVHVWKVRWEAGINFATGGLLSVYIACELVYDRGHPLLHLTGASHPCLFPTISA